MINYMRLGRPNLFLGHGILNLKYVKVILNGRVSNDKDNEN